MTLFGDVKSDVSLIREFSLNSINWTKGITAPIDVTIGTTPDISALLFGNTNELISTYVRVPERDVTTNVNLILMWSLVNAEQDGYSADWTLDYVVPIPFSTGDGPDKLSTRIGASTTVTTVNGLAPNDVYETTFTLDVNDLNNPLANSEIVGLGLEIHLTNTTGVGEVHLLDVILRFTATR